MERAVGSAGLQIREIVLWLSCPLRLQKHPVIVSNDTLRTRFHHTVATFSHKEKKKHQGQALLIKDTPNT